MRFLRQSLTGLFLFALPLGLLFFAGFTIVSAVQDRIADGQRSAERNERSFSVSVITATPQTVSPVLTAYGEVQSGHILEIRAKAAGTLIELAENFEEGASVEAGQRLALIDPTNAEFALSRAESELQDSKFETQEAQSALELSRDELTAAIDQAGLRDAAYERQKDLEGRGVGTTAAMETAELVAAQARGSVIAARRAVLAAEARVDQAQTRLARSTIAHAEAQKRLKDTEVMAGFTGRLSDVNVVEGRLVAVNEQLGTLIDSDKLEVAFRVSTAQYSRLIDETGALILAPISARLTSFGQDLTVTGQIIREAASVGENGTGRVIFAALEDARALKPGEFVTVEVSEPPLKDVVRLPSAALGADGAVLVLDGDSRLRAQPVSLMRRQGDDILVRAPDLEGAQVVTERTPLLGEGIKVLPRNQAAAEPGAEGG